MNEQLLARLSTLFDKADSVPDDGGAISDLKSCFKNLIEIIETDLQNREESK